MKIIITETQLKNIIDEATLERDQEFYKEAEKFYEEMIYKIKYERILKRVEDDDTLLGIDGSDVLSGYDDLSIFFDENFYETHGALGGHGEYPDGEHVIYINVFSVSHKIHLQIENSRYKGVFIHEFIHYLDSKRYIGKYVKPKGYHDDDNVYYNDSSEFNAYYQMAGGKLLNSIVNTYSNVYEIRRNYKTFDEFYNWVTKEFFDPDFIKYLNQTNIKKLKKRIFNIYYEYIKTDKPQLPKSRRK